MFFPTPPPPPILTQFPPGNTPLLSSLRRSWYSWILSSLVGAVYMFGFILQCPQASTDPTLAGRPLGPPAWLPGATSSMHPGASTCCVAPFVAVKRVCSWGIGLKS